MGASVETAAGAARRVAALCGPARSGKTEALAERAAGLLAQGVAAEGLLLLAPGADGARAFAGRLAGRAGAAARDVRACSVRALALEVLATPEAAAHLGYVPRAAVDAEEALAAADLRACGFDAEAVRSARARLDAAWDAGDDPAAPGDPAADALRARLAARGLVPVRALAATALACLRADGALAARMRRPYVLVDDANGLSPAAVALACALAGEGCLMAGDPSWSPTLFDPGARARAFVEAADGPADELAAPPRRIAARRAYAVKWARPDDEQDGCQAYVAHLFAKVAGQAGTAGTSVHGAEDALSRFEGAEVCVVVPNRTWASAFEAKLAELGVPATELLAHRPLAGDPRRARTNGPLRAFALLGLLARPDDTGLWRLWCALDRPDMACPAWAALEDHARTDGVPVAAALAALAPDAFAGADALTAAYAQARAFLDANAAKRGHALCKAVNPAGLPAFAALCAPVEGGEDAAALFARVCANAADRRFDDDPRKVRVGCAESFLGVPAPYVVALGCNEGMAPSADPARDPRAFADGTAAYLHVFSQAQEELVVSYAQRCPAEAAAKLGLATRRSRTEHGVELAQLRPAPCLSLLGPEAPSTMSGQQFRSCVLDLRA